MSEYKTRDSFKTFEDQAERKKAEREKEQRQRAFDEKLTQLAEKTVDVILERGQEDYLAEIMKTFLDVAVEMKTVVEMVQSVNIATSCIYEAIGFLDSAMNFEQGLQAESLAKKYGFFQRIKQKLTARKALRNNMNRMTAVVDNIMGQLKMAQGTVGMLQKMSDRMKVMMGKTTAKSKKLASVNGASGASTHSSADKLIASIMAKRGLATETVATTGSDDGASSSSSNTDISDIV